MFSSVDYECKCPCKTMYLDMWITCSSDYSQSKCRFEDLQTIVGYVYVNEVMFESEQTPEEMTYESTTQEECSLETHISLLLNRQAQLCQ